MKKNNINIAIIGGGISGISTAFYLNKYLPEAKITLFESEPKLGGKMKSITRDGFVFEEGSNGFLSNKPDTLKLIKEANLEHLLIPSSDKARKRFIFTGTLYKLPESLKEFLTTSLLSMRGKLRILKEFFIPAKKDDNDESLQDFGYRRVGKEMTDKLLDPMVAGIFASTPKQISVNAAFPAIVNLEKKHGGLFRGMLAKKKRQAGPSGILMSFKGGVSTFIEALSQKIKAQIYTNTKISKITKKDEQFELYSNDKIYEFDQIILCTPSFVSSKLLKDIDTQLSQQLSFIEYSPISVVGFGYTNLKHPLDGFGLLTASSAKKDILGVLYDSSIFSDRAAQNTKLLRIMIGGARDKSIALKPKEELIGIAKTNLKEILNIKEEPSSLFFKTYTHGIPNYKVGHIKTIKNIFKTLNKHQNIYLNSNAYNGIGLNDCISNSKKCAKKITKIIQNI